MTPITYFKSQFPDGTIEEISHARYCTEKKKYVDFNLDIGWSLYTVNIKSSKDNRRVHFKGCLGSVYCTNSGCRFFGLDVRPASSFKLIEKQCCLICEKQLSHKGCKVKVNFEFKGDECTLKHVGNHSHKTYLPKHLTVEEKVKLNKVVKKDPLITPKAAVVGVSAKTGEVVESFSDSINEILSNKDRVKYEINTSKRSQGMAKRGEFLGEFGKIEKEFDGFIQSAEVASSKFCIIFAAPEMKKYDLPFDAYPIVTDVTYKAVEHGYYLCSSVLYVPALNKHLVIYQAIIGGLETRYFTKYFESLFEHFEINLEKFMGVIMDFSSAQRKGFLEAYERAYFKTSQPLPDGRRFLKGCYMHWMQSVQRLVSNYAVIPREQSKQFLQLVYTLRTTDSYPIYMQSILDLAISYPNCKKWLKWWLQPSNASMIFRCGSFQHPALLNHHVRTTNAVESYHGVLYGLIVKEQSLSVSLRYILSFCKNDGRTLFSFFEKGIKPSYGKKKRRRVRKRITDFYKASDSRAPDNNATLFSEKEVVYEEEEEEKEGQKRRKASANLNKSMLVEKEDVVEDEVELFFGKVNELDLISGTEEKLMGLEKKICDYIKSIESKEDYEEITEIIAQDTLDLINQSIDYNMTINPNKDSSCYIDAIFELLWNAVLPHTYEDIVSKGQSLNEYDTKLIQTYEMYHSRGGNGRVKASETIREFVWSCVPNQTKGEWGDCAGLFEHFLENMSAGMRSFCEVGAAYRFRLCSKNEDHSEFDPFSMSMLTYTSSPVDALYRERKKTCRKCIENDSDGETISYNLLEEMPQFLLFSDITNLLHEDEGAMSDYPNSIFVYGCTYTLHGKIFSTDRSGVHFYATCRITCDRTSFVGQIDNLKSPKITVVSENDLQNRKNVVVVCYKKNI